MGRRFGRWLLRIAVAALAVLAVLAVVVGAVLGTRAGRLWVAEQALSQAPRAGLTIAVEGLDWPELGRIAFARLAISDNSGAWLEVEALKLDWRPGALISAVAEIERIDIGRVALLRVPEVPERTAPPTESSEPLALPTLPGSLRVGALDVRLIEIAPAVAGEAVSLTGGIAMRWPEQGALTLSATLREANAGRTALSADIGLDRAGQLSLAVLAEDAAGGVLSKILAVAEWPETRLKLDGVGPLTDWQGEFRAEVGALANATGRVAANLADMSRVAVDGEGEVEGGLPALFGVTGLPNIKAALSAEVTDLQRLELRNLRVVAPASTFEVNGAIHADGRIEALNVDATAAAADWSGLLPPDIAFDAATILGQVTGTVEQPVARMQVAVDRLRGPQGLTMDKASCTLAVDPTDEHWRADGDCTLNGPAGDAMLQAALGSRATLSFAALWFPREARVALSRLQLDAAQVALTATGAVRLPAKADDLPAGEIEASVRVPDLAPLARVQAVPVSGPLSVAIKGTSDADGAVEGRVAVDGKPRWGDELGVPPALRGSASVSTEFALDPGLVLTLSAGRLALGQLQGSFAGSARLPDGALAMTTAVRLPDSSQFVLPVGALAAGPSEVNLTIGGTIAVPRIEGQARTPDLALPQVVLEDPRAGFTVSLRGADFDAAVHGLTEIDGATVSLEGSASLRGADQVQVHSLSLAGLGLTIQGAVNGSLSDNLWQGQLALTADDLATIASPFGQTLAGSVNAAVDLVVEDGRQAVNATARLSSLSWEQEGAVLTADGLSLDASLRDLFGAPAAVVRASATRVVSPQLRVSELAMEVDGAIDAMSWTLQLAAEREAPLNLSMDGTASVRDSTAQLTVNALSGQLAEAPLSLRQPLRLALAADRQSLSDLALGIGEGRIDADIALDPKTLAGRLSVSALPLEPIAQFAAGVSATGALTLTSALDWTAERQSLKAEARIAGVGLAEQGQEWPPLDIALVTDWQGREMAIDGTITGIGNAPGEISARLPLVAGAGPPQAALRQDGPLSGRLRWQGEIGPLVALLPLSEHRLSGQGALDLSVAGTVAEPRLVGDARLSDGAYEHLHWGTQMANLNLVASGDSSGSLVLKGSGDDTKQGTLAVEGAVKLDDPAQPTGWLTVKLVKLQALARDELRGEVSADLRAEGGLQELLLSGGTTVERMEIKIPDRLPPSVVDLQIKEVGEPTRAPPPAPEEKTGAGPLTRLDLVVSMPARVFVRGRGLDSEWGGELTITGTSRKPQIRGTLQVIRGKFAFAGRSFEISSGTLRFLGGDEVEPILDITIAHSRPDLTATIKLSGPVSAPTLSLTSEPTLPDDEILARVIFGKSVRELSPLQSLQLAQSVAQISGALSGGGVMDTLRQTLGVDALTVDSGEDGPKVGVGKYLLDNVYVGVRQGATAGSGELAAEIELTPHISLESEIGQDARSNIDLNWHLDY